MVPPQGGFRFCGSPETLEGAQENNMTWKPEFGEKVQCQFTGTLFPNAQYPENGFIDFPTPAGKTQRFHYHEAPNGRKYWFEARKWYEQRVLLERTAHQLAQLYTLNPIQYSKAGRYAALLLTRFAQLFPDYIVTFDYPGRDKEFYSEATYPAAVVKRGQDAWRLARWSWWAYFDVSENLLLTYHLLKKQQALSADKQQMIVQNLFSPMLELVGRYAKLSTTNMHPTLWSAQAVASNVLSIPALADSVDSGISKMLREQFTHDGFWKEVSVSYHRQTASGLYNVYRKLHPSLNQKALSEKMEQTHPALLRATRATDAFRLPNGHYASINDTWSADAYSPVIEASSRKLLTGVGYGVLGMGSGKNQLQAHLNFNGRFGHDHYANLNLTLFAEGEELLSDIGYTHTKARTWATSSTAHNLVVVNGISQASNQSRYSGRGNLLLSGGDDTGLQLIEADATDNYASAGITMYRRALIAIATADSNHYVADIFTVRGPGQKDYILHSSADTLQEIRTESIGEAPLSWKEKSSLVPEGRSFKPIDDLFDFKLLWQPYWAHGNFREVKQASVVGPFRNTFTFKHQPSKGLQTWFPSQTRYGVNQALSWNVRGANENQGKLDAHLRSSLIVSGTDSVPRFTAVHVPFDGQEPVLRCETVYEDDNAVVLKIALADGATDYLVYQQDNGTLSIQLEKEAFKFDGRVAFIRKSKNGTVFKMVEGTQLSWGEKSLSGSRRFAAPLSTVTGNELTVDGVFDVQPGEIIVVAHGDGQTSSFEVASVSARGPQTILTTAEPAVMTLRQDKSLELNVFPFLRFPGPHKVSSSRVTGKTF